MHGINTSLLREKFVIHDGGRDNDDDSIVALSNRLVIDLASAKDTMQEQFIIRGHNMHSCIRMAARIIKAYDSAGPLIGRVRPFDWDASWDVIVNDYEARFNPDRWIAVYNNGKTVFEAGDHHMFLDIIEQCNIKHDGPYESAIPMAEDAFKQAGKVVKIDHDANVALVIDIKNDSGRFGVILRGPNKTTTFNFTVTSKDKTLLNIPQCLGTASCFLEAVQLSFLIGMNTEKIRTGILDRHSDDARQVRTGRARLGRIGAEISNLESTYTVRYRPEKPDFNNYVLEAEKIAQKILSSHSDIDEDEEDEVYID